MSNFINIKTPLEPFEIRNLRAGDRVLLSGTIYTARDIAHKRLIELINKGEKLPFNINGSVIYYTGPAPAPPGTPIGSCGPTTSERMDKYTPTLLEHGLRGMIGKGNRNSDVRLAIDKYNAIYFLAIGGAAAICAKSVISSEIIAFNELGPEAIHKLEVKDMPLIVGIDSYGKDFLDQE